LKTIEKFWGKFFGKVKNGQKKCPKIEKGETVLRILIVCDHN